MDRLNNLITVAVYVTLLFIPSYASFGEYGPIITGSVVDSTNGQPLSDVTVTIVDEPSAYSSSISSCTTVSNGSFIDTLTFFFNMGTVGNIRITACKPGYYLPGFYRNVPRLTSNSRITLLPYNFTDVARGIKVVVKDSMNGTVIPGATATLFDYDSVEVKLSSLKPAIKVVTWVPVSIQKTDDQGVVAFFSDTIGTFMVRIDAPGYVKTIIEIGKTGINELREETVNLVKPVTHFVGVVKDSLTQQPIKNASAQLRRLVYRQGQTEPTGYHVVETVNSDELGRYTFERLAQATDYRVYVTMPGYYPDSTTFEVPAFNGTPLAPLSATIKLLTSRGSITGRVYDAFTSHPLDSAIVYLSVMTFKKTGTIWIPRDSIISSTRSVKNGTYSFSGLEADYWYTVQGTFPLYKNSEDLDVTVNPAESTQTDISLLLASGLNASVLDSVTGNPISGAEVVVSGTRYIMKNDVMTKENFVIDSAVTDSAGRVSLPLELNNVVNRNYTVTSRVKGYSNKSQTFSIDTTDPVAGLYFYFFAGSNPILNLSLRSVVAPLISVRHGSLIVTTGKSAQLRLHDVSGRIIFSKILSQGMHKIDLDKHRSTMLLVTVQDNSGMLLSKKLCLLR